MNFNCTRGIINDLRVVCLVPQLHSTPPWMISTQGACARVLHYSAPDHSLTSIAQRALHPRYSAEYQGNRGTNKKKLRSTDSLRQARVLRRRGCHKDAAAHTRTRGAGGAAGVEHESANMGDTNTEGRLGDICGHTSRTDSQDVTRHYDCTHTRGRGACHWQRLIRGESGGCNSIITAITTTHYTTHFIHHS